MAVKNSTVDTKTLSHCINVGYFFHRDVSATALTKLPSQGLESVLVLFAQSAYTLKSLPPLQGLWSLREAHLTYNSHCCALLNWNTHR